MSADGYMTDAATRHQVYVQRFGSGLAGKAAKFVRKAIKRAKEAVNEGLSQYATARYNRQIETLRGDLNAIYGELSQQQKLDLGEFAQYEFTFNSKLIGQIVKASVRLAEPSAEMIAAAVLADPLELAVGRGRQVIDITGALAQFGSKKTADILSEIAIGSSLGETQKQIVSRLTSLGVSHEEQAGSLVRTMTNHVASSARAETLKQNDDILQGHRWISTLDGRTTPVCRARDRQIYPLDGPKPPAHWGCRSSIVPVLKPEYQREIPGSTRPSVGPDGVEQVSSRTTYGEWLARQPASFQKEVLGPARYRLFSKGELSIDRFVDDNGKQYTLDQLKELEPHAFELAGLD
ncbi:MAG: minor capsid protein [Mixta calida]|uniref:minor capsid protein n=1 Tax=Mixta calida TaxID=665913 RepID=UPI00290642CE|nr:minor capsid protein [Mixta calida]MDU4943806.1 minor capsid protein [Mixta calida]